MANNHPNRRLESISNMVWAFFPDEEGDGTARLISRTRRGSRDE
jgi:hypothetical protein